MNVLIGVLTALYPVLIYLGLTRFQPRVLALLLVLVALLRWRKGGDLITGLGWEGSVAVIVPLFIAVSAGINNNEISLKLYPVAVNLTLLITFGMTLFRNQSMIERIARMRHPDLPPEGVKYTRRVTEIWCVFFFMNGAISAWTVWYASRETWALFNGFISYIMIGTLFAAEWLYRRNHLQLKREQ